MLNIVRRLTVLGALCLLAAGCAGGSHRDLSLGLPEADTRIQHADKPLQCVPFARAQSGINIFGDAYTWWDKAAGHYARFFAPQTGAILVLDQYGGPKRAHLGVVRMISGPREIHIDHANWLDEGTIHLDDPVLDVSAENDWSQVKVFNLKTGTWGTRVYHVKGFIGPGPAEDGYEGSSLVASSN